MGLLFFAILILLNVFFSISEISIVTSKRTRLEQLAQAGNKGALAALELQKNSEMFLSAVLVGMTLVGLTIGAYGGMSIATHLAPYIEQIDILQPYAPEIAMVLVMVVITYITILIGELIPKTIALSNPEKVASVMARPITLFSHLFYPFVKLLSVSARFSTGVLGIKKRDEFYTEYELRQMIKSASLEGVMEEEQTDMHEKVFYFSDKRAMHIMTHRTEVEWVDLNKSEKELREDLNRCQHAKIVCAKATLDNFKGIIHLRDFYKASLSQRKFKVTDLIKEPVVIHESTPATLTLKLLKQNSQHFCLVVDEYGDFEGVVTFHDIMENFIGDVPEEGEQEEQPFVEQADGSFIFNGDAPVEVLSQVIESVNIDFEEIDYATVAGFVIDQISEIPHEGDTFSYLDYQIEVIQMDGNRIDKILVRKELNPDIGSDKETV